MDAECGFHHDPNGADLLAIHGPTILVDIGFDPAYDPKTATTPPVPLIQNMLALVDTGASESFIDNGLAVALQLPVVDKGAVSGSIGSHPSDIYVAQIRVPALNVNIYGRFSGVNLIAGGQSHSVLLGRTFLRRLVMSYDGKTGRVTLTTA
jgi:predicted aspartyl protease